MEKIGYGFDLELTLSPVIHIRVDAKTEEEAIEKIQKFCNDEKTCDVYYVDFQKQTKLATLRNLVDYTIENPDKLGLTENLIGCHAQRYTYSGEDAAGEEDENYGKVAFSEAWGVTPQAIEKNLSKLDTFQGPGIPKVIGASYKTLVLSTAHLSSKDNDTLLSLSCLDSRILAREFGFFVKLANRAKVSAAAGLFDNSDLSDSFQSIVRYAIENDYRLIEFDSEGPEAEVFEVFS